MPLFDENPHRGLRRVIDISGDGPQQQRPAGDHRPRCRDREGHRHQRPADHGQGAVLLHDGYRQPRFLLRDCVVGGPGAFVVTIKDREKIQGSDPNEVVARSRRSHPGTSGRSGRRGSQGAARQLPDRREDLAGPVGKVSCSRSPDGAKRNPGMPPRAVTVSPDCASLHPAYRFIS